MNIDNLTIGEAKQIARLFQNETNTDAEPDQNHGLCIVVLDNGFVYVGTLITGAKFLTIDNARNIRRWGTARGLGQLALDGPQPNTKLDECGSVRALLCELKHWIICEESKWK